MATLAALQTCVVTVVYRLQDTTAMAQDQYETWHRAWTRLLPEVGQLQKRANTTSRSIQGTGFPGLLAQVCGVCARCL